MHPPFDLQTSKDTLLGDLHRRGGWALPRKHLSTAPWRPLLFAEKLGVAPPRHKLRLRPAGMGASQ